jgi:hypothetical protein
MKTVAMILALLVALPSHAQRRRSVSPGPEKPPLALECKPAELLPELAAQCREARHAEGRRLFELETFGGNGRTCQTCHSKATGTFSADDAKTRLTSDPRDPLFLHDALDDGTTGTSQITKNATIRVTLPLPSHLRLVDDPAATHVTFRRGTPTTKNTPALDTRLMLDLREPSLESQAGGAIHGHAQSTIEPTKLQLELIAEFQRTDAKFFSDDQLFDFAKSGVPPLLPVGTTDAEKRGRKFFEDIFPGNSMEGACAVCHSGPMLNETNRFAPRLIQLPKGLRIGSVLVSDRNALGNPTYRFEIRDGSITAIVTTPDIGILMSDPSSPAVAEEIAKLGTGTRLVLLANMFKIPSLWGVKNTAPYFHDNSAKDFDELLEHYNVFFESLGLGRDALKPEDIEDIKAFLNLL